MDDMTHNAAINRITAHADEAFGFHARTVADRDRALEAPERFVALRLAGLAAQHAMRVEICEKAAREVASAIPLDSDWRPVAQLLVNKLRQASRSASLAAIAALEGVRSKPLGSGVDAAGGAL